MEYRPNPNKLYLSASLLNAQTSPDSVMQSSRLPITYSHSGLSYLETVSEPDCCDICFSGSQKNATPGNGSCILAIVFISIGIITFLAGLIATLLYHVAGVIFQNSVYKGALAGPLTMGVSSIPIIIGLVFICNTRNRLKEYSEQIRAEESIINRKVHRDLQSRQATDSILDGSNMTYPHLAYPKNMETMQSFTEKSNLFNFQPSLHQEQFDSIYNIVLNSPDASQSMTIAKPMKARVKKLR